MIDSTQLPERCQAFVPDNCRGWPCLSPSPLEGYGIHTSWPAIFPSALEGGGARGGGWQEHRGRGRRWRVVCGETRPTWSASYGSPSVIGCPDGNFATS